MSKRPGWRPANSYVPRRVDLAGLRADLAAFMAQPRLSESTVSSYTRCLKRFRSWCESRELRAFPTTPAVLGAFLAAGLLGTARTVVDTSLSDQAEAELEPLCMSSVDQVWAAIAWWHDRERLPNPTADLWARTVRRGLRRALAGHRVRKAPPLSAADMRQLTNVAPTWTPAGLAERALLLAATILPVRLADLAVLPPAALRLTSPTRGELTCGTRTFPVECSCVGVESVECLLCALRACAELVPSEAALLFGIRNGGSASAEDYRLHPSGDVTSQVSWARRVIYARAHRQRGCWPIELRHGQVTVDPSVAADPRLLAGLRHGLALSTSEDGLLLLQLRAALLLAWHRGLRSDDLRRRLRRDLEREERGYRLLIESSKGDRQQNGVVLGVRPARDPRLDPVAALDEWLAVLDAATAARMPAEQVPLLVGCPRGVNLSTQPRSYNWFWRRFAALQERAGLTGFTPHSTRTGFAVTAADAGATVTQLRSVMRHKKVNTAVGYVMSRAARSRPAPLILAHATGAA